MNKFKLNGSRRYILKRLIAFILIRSSILRKLYFKIFPKKYNVNINDTEQIFIALEAERELENIWFINQIVSFIDINYYVDIGCNYSQFASSLKIPSANSIMCDLNSDAIYYSSKLSFNFRTSRFINSAIVPSYYEGDVIDVAINNHNSGLSSIIDKSLCFTNYHTLKPVTATKITSLIPSNQAKGILLYKIDIEGQECSLAYDLLENSNIRSEDIIFCCEILNADKLKEFRIFESKFDRKFVYIRYKNFSKTGLVYRAPFEILKVLIFGNLFFEIVVASSIDEIDQSFIPLLFSIPSHLFATINFKLFDTPNFE